MACSDQRTTLPKPIKTFHLAFIVAAVFETTQYSSRKKYLILNSQTTKLYRRKYIQKDRHLNLYTVPTYISL